MLTSRLFSRRPRRASSEGTAAGAPVRASLTPRPAPAAASVEALEPRQLFAVVPGFNETLVASGLSRPTKLTVAPDGRVFVSLQDGQVRVIKDGKLLNDPFVSIPVVVERERGLQGLAFDPDFATNKYVYVYHSTAEGDRPHNRITRFTANGDVADPASATVIFDTDHFGDSGLHNGGAMDFGSDGKLYVGVGDNNYAQDAQIMSVTRGKILRINKDGSIPSDGPFFNSATNKAKAAYAIGVRNPFSLDIQPGTGRMVIADVGAGSWEEINEGRAGANYGWPKAEGPSDDPQYDDPIYGYQHTFGKAAIVGVQFYNPRNPTFPAEYVGDVFYADYEGGFIKSVDLSTNEVKDFASGIPNITDIQTADDGSVYYLQRNGGRVFRVTAATGNPAAPNISVPPQSRTVAIGAPATFSVEAAGGEPLEYQWQRNGEDIPGATAASYTINSTGPSDNNDKFRVVVSNSAGAATSSEATLMVLDDQPPTATITLPADGTLWTGGGQITFSGAGTDPEDGTLPASAFTWEVQFHHDTHTHPAVAPFSGKTSETITIPAIGETDPDVWYRIHLTVTDSAGLTHSTFKDVFPQKVNIALRTEPAGLGLELDDSPVAVPFDTAAVVGLERRLGAPATQTLNGVTYDFASWSDGGAAVHGIVTPGADTVYTAVYRARSVGEPPPGDGDLAVDAVDGMKPGVAGRPGRVRVHVANRTTAPIKAPANVELFLSTDATLDAGDTTVTTPSARMLKLKPGATRPLAVKFAYPPVPADGNYFVLARVAGSDTTASVAPMLVRNPAVDLSGSVGDTSRGAPVPRGGRASTSVTLLNTGTDPVSGPLAATLFAVPAGEDPLTGARTQLATVTKTVRINANRAKKLRLNYAVPTSLTPGNYTLVFTVDSGNAFAEPNETNNTSVAAVPLAVT